MTRKILVILLFINFVGHSQVCDMMEIRSLYEEASYSRTLSDSLIDKLEYCKHTDVLRGYMGVSQMILAKHVFNPFKKSRLFFSGRDLLEKVISDDSENIELRFLRFCVQSSAPNFLGYNNSIKEDEKMIKNRYKALDDQDLMHRIESYFNQPMSVDINFTSPNERTSNLSR